MKSLTSPEFSGVTEWSFSPSQMISGAQPVSVLSQLDNSQKLHFSHYGIKVNYQQLIRLSFWQLSLVTAKNEKSATEMFSKLLCANKNKWGQIKCSIKRFTGIRIEFLTAGNQIQHGAGYQSPIIYLFTSWFFCFSWRTEFKEKTVAILAVSVMYDVTPLKRHYFGFQLH